MEKNVDFHEMNLYIRYVQKVEGVEELYYLPWRIIYDNFLIYVDEGSIRIQFENKDIVLHEHELYIIPPFIKNRIVLEEGKHCWYYGIHFDFVYGADSADFDEDVYIPENMGYDKHLLMEIPVDEHLMHRDIYSIGDFKFPAKIRMSEHTQFHFLFDKLLKTFYSSEMSRVLLLKSIFYEMMYLIIGEISLSGKEKNMDEHEAVSRYLSIFSDVGSMDSKVNYAQIALEYGMSQKKFREVFKAMMKKTPKEYAIDQKMEKARELLETGKYRVNEVAYLVGYDDVFYFSKLFKKKMGISPRNMIERDEDRTE